MENIFELKSVSQYCNLYGLDQPNPQIAVIDLNKAVKANDFGKWKYGIYALYLKMEKQCDIMYGRTPYDYQEGTIVCFAPGQSVEVKINNTNIRQNVLGVLFHPDLIEGTSLGRTMKKYSFFSYEVNEALHVSDREREIIIECLRILDMELRSGSDSYSKTLIINNLELLLNYCMRFYERQFATRLKAGNNIVKRFDDLVNEYFDGDSAETRGLPTVKYFAGELCLSPNYFGDFIKKSTGKSPQDYIQSKIVELAKERLSASSDSVSSIAYSLGFQYPQHFCRLFKNLSGLTPTGYRKSLEPQY